METIQFRLQFMNYYKYCSCTTDDASRSEYSGLGVGDHGMKSIDHGDRTEALRDVLAGTLLEPEDDGYDEARSVFNGMIDKYPAVIAQCTNTDDVVATVQYARETNTPLSVKAGGHNFAGKAICEDGVVIDLSPMKGVEVDPTAKTAKVAAGTLLGEFDEAVQAHGLATTAGVYSETGVAGLTLGGGIGWLMRNCGLACDNLLAAEMVTAEGDVIAVDEESHPDLLWGLRGGGGNFGVVTSFEFQLQEIGPEVLTIQAFHPHESGRAALQHYRDVMANAPDELTCFAMILSVPPMEPFPEEYHGTVAVAYIGCWSGEIETGKQVLKPLEQWGDPIFSTIAPMEYTAFQSAFDAGQPPGERYYGKSSYVDELSDEVIDVVLSYTETLPGLYSSAWFESMGGAVGRVDPTETAFPHREAAYNLGLMAGWSDPSDDTENMNWVRAIADAVRPHATGGVYANYLDQGDDDEVTDAFGQNYDQLASLKATWDPDNVFHMTQNIRPEAE